MVSGMSLASRLTYPACNGFFWSLMSHRGEERRPGRQPGGRGVRSPGRRDGDRPVAPPAPAVAARRRRTGQGGHRRGLGKAAGLAAEGTGRRPRPVESTDGGYSSRARLRRRLQRLLRTVGAAPSRSSAGAAGGFCPRFCPRAAAASASGAAGEAAWPPSVLHHATARSSTGETAMLLRPTAPHNPSMP